MKRTLKKKNSLNIDALFHVTGKTTYLNDMPELAGTLYAKVHYSKIANGRILSINTSKAKAVNGIIRIIDYKDIPGENQIGGIIPDEVLLAINEVHYVGMPILIIIAESEMAGHKADKLIEIEYEEHPVVIDPLVAYNNQDFVSNSQHFSCGDIKKAYSDCHIVIEGNVESGGQEHVYLEPQGTYAIPQGIGSLLIYSSTQGPMAVQHTVARVLGVSMNQVEVDVNRLGGGFGGKEDQASPWAAMAGLAAYLLKKPIKLVLERGEDLIMTGKRHPYKSTYKMGLDAHGKIMAFEAVYYQNSGAVADLSPAVLQRTLFHGTNSYFIPNVNLDAYACRTNLPPNTAFRGFGGPQGMFVIEAAIHHASRELGVAAVEIQENNLIKENEAFSYGQNAENCEASRCWHQAKKSYELEKINAEIEAFNNVHKHIKKGMALMPICFGISFTNTMMNNARALVHVYHDGSVGISTGAVEMGQGVSSKMIQVASLAFGIDHGKIKLESTNTTRVANTSPTAASATADLNGKALQDACQQIKVRLRKLLSEEWHTNVNTIIFDNNMIRSSKSEDKITWNDAIHLAFTKRVNLSAKGHYATPKIYFDTKTSKGNPFAYHVYGTAIITSTVDCLRGNYEIDDVLIVHDFGASMNHAVDLGQIEGATVQGIGWMTIEELIYNKKGQLKSSNLANYKIPDIYSAPNTLDVQFLETQGNDLAILKSKAVGEPPLMYGIGAYFSIYNAILAFNRNANIPYSSPMTTEKVLMGLYGK